MRSRKQEKEGKPRKEGIAGGSGVGRAQHMQDMTILEDVHVCMQKRKAAST